MFSASDLSEDQIDTIKEWVSDGAQMADVQKRLKDEFGFNVTYMDTRFLSLDLELEFQVDEEPEPEPEAEQDAENPSSPEAGGAGPDDSGEIPPGAGGGVVATLDQVARPGSMVSGSVTFSDGMKGVWMIDEMGRPSIDPDQPGYQPTESDLVAFQQQLQGLLEGHM